MKITLPLFAPAFDDNRITEDLQRDFDIRSQLYVFKSEDAWKDDPSSPSFSVWVEYANPENEKILMFDTDLDDLEMFASSILKSIEMLRRDYADILAEKRRNGDLL